MHLTESRHQCCELNCRNTHTHTHTHTIFTPTFLLTMSTAHGGGGGFFHGCNTLGGRFNKSFPAFSFFFFFLILQWRSSDSHCFCSSGKDWSTVAQQAKTTVDEHSLMSCLKACFPDNSAKFPHYAWTAQSGHSNFIGSRVYDFIGSRVYDFIGSRVYVCLAGTCQQHFWQNDPGLLQVTVITWGWN